MGGFSWIFHIYVSLQEVFDHLTWRNHQNFGDSQAEENLSETQELGESDAEVASQGADGWGVPWRAPKNMAGEGDFMRKSYGI